MGFVFCRFNVVGYFQKNWTVAQDFGILSFQWDKVDGSARALNGLLKCSVMGTAFNHNTEEECTPGWTATAPMIEIRRADGGYDILYYIDDAWDMDKEEAFEGWADSEGMLRNPSVTLGQGAWVRTPVENAVFTIAGAVSGTAQDVGGDTSNFALAGGSFPVAFGPNDANVTWTCTPGTAFNHNTEEECTPGWTENAPMLEIRRDDGGYDILYYCDDAWDMDKEEAFLGWADSEGMLRNPTIAVGGGFWMKNPNDNGVMFVRVANPLQ